MSYKNKYLFFIFLFIGQTITAQNEQALNGADYLWQSSLTNPAIVPKGNRIVVALPSAFANISSPVPMGKYVVTRNDIRVLDIWSTRWLESLKEFNTMEVNAHVLSFAVSVPIKKRLRVSLYHQIISNGLFDFSNDAAAVIYNGNDAFIGKKAFLYNHLSLDVRSELGLGLAYQINNLSLGIRFKSQNGLMSAFTTSETLNLTTGTEHYGLNLESDYKLQIYGAGKGFKELFLRNSGYAFDWGFKLKWENYEFTGSCLDVGGKVWWKHNAKTYTSKGQQAFYGFKSIDVEKTTFKTFTDTLQKALNIKDEKGNHYRRELDPRIYVGVNRIVANNLRLGLNFFIQGKPQGELQGLNVGAMLTATTSQLWDHFDMGISVGSRTGANSLDVGLHGAVKVFKKAQLYFVTDNVISYILPAKAKAINGRMGINLFFGKEEVNTENEVKKIKKKKKFKLQIKRYWYKPKRYKQHPI